MDIMEFTAAMEARGMVASGNIFCGVYKRIPYTVIFRSGKPTGQTQADFMVRFASMPKKSIEKGLCKPFGKSCSPQAADKRKNRNDMHLVLKTQTAEQFAEVLDAILAQLPAVIEENTLALPDTCPICKAASCDSYSFVTGNYVPVHATCVRVSAEEKTQALEQNNDQGSYIKGFLGALLGGIIGSVPNILMMYFAHRTYSLLYALIPLAAFFGYKLLGGRVNKAAFWVVSIISVVLAPLTDIATAYITGVVEYNYYLSFSDIMILVGDREFLGSMGVSVLFVLLGIYAVKSYIGRTNIHEMQELDSAVKTTRPMGP